MKIYTNGKPTQLTQANVSIFSDALQRGFGIFETLKVENQKVYRLEDHLQRLFESAKKIDLKIEFTTNQITSHIKNIIADCKNLTLAKLKIFIIPQKVILTLEPYTSVNKKSVKLKSLHLTRSLPEIKAISYLPSYYANRKAKAAGFYDALLINDHSEITEGAYCNIFWVKNGQIFTRAKQVLPGITRKAILEFSPIPVQFKNATLPELIEADEVFLTQSLGGVIPVTHIDQHPIGLAEPGRVSQLIQVAYLKDRKSKSTYL